LSLALLFFAGAAHADSQQIYLQCLTNFETYAETIWTDAAYIGAPADAGYWGDGTSNGNGGIRGNGGVALAYAVLCLAYPADLQFSNRLSRVRQALNYNAGTHVTGTNKCVNGTQWGWSSGTLATCSSDSGSDWQSSLWAAEMGLACVLVQSNLPAATVAAVQRVIASEANHRGGVAPCSGYLGDTKAEENGWDSNVLALGAAWLSSNTNAAAWLTAAMSYLANTYTVADTNGDPLASWITTVNLYPDYALQNHGFFHPEYQYVSGEEMGDSWLMARLANPNVAAQLSPFAEHNVLAVWTNFQHCVMDSGEAAFPAGEDWALHSYGQNSHLAWLTVHFNDPVARWDEAQVAVLERYRQMVNTNGMFVGPSGGGFYREAVQAYRTAMAWLQWANAENPTGPTSPASTYSIIHMPDVGIIEQHGANGYCSVSYGPQTAGSAPHVMAVIEAPTKQFSNSVYTVTPRCPGVMGLGAMGTPTAGRLVSLTTNGNTFQAELQLTNGANGTTEVYIGCTGESIGILEVPWPASGVSNSLAASFITGIENAPLTGGSRLVEWSGGSASITNLSGASASATNNWICVAGHYGLAAGPAGYFNYKAATSYTRVMPGLNESGTAEDSLQFYPTNSLTPRYAVYFPGRNALQTSNLAAQISWTLYGTNVTLTFPGADGATAQLSGIVPPQPVYLPYALSVASVSASSYQAAFPPTNAVDGNYNDFWVSSGANPGQGPTAQHPEWLFVTFPRLAAVSEFKVYPRTVNGGYGPKNMQMLLNGASIYSGTMAPTTTLDVELSPPVYATNAELYISSSYDPDYPTNSRNVQVVEMVFYERALPGTFADWQLQFFTDAQLENPAISSTAAEPAGGNVPNLLEFVVDGNPWTPVLANFALTSTLPSANQVAIQFRERPQLGNVTRQFQASTDLINWSDTSPLSVITQQILGTVLVYQAVFPTQQNQAFYRIRYSLTN
jgi:hypothetical protein